ncbi:MAG: toprim domain-containing protein [bacterium]
MDPLDKLTEIFKKFPGIGPRQAKRFVYHILQEDEADVAELINAISNIKRGISICDKCYRYFENKNKQAVVPCPICSSTSRDQSTLMLVVKDIDLLAVERSRAYNGLYFVLGNTVPILDDEPHKKIRQGELLYRINELVGVENKTNKDDNDNGSEDKSNDEDEETIEKLSAKLNSISSPISSMIKDSPKASSNLKEVIIATSVNTEGEHTAFYLNTLLRPYVEKYGFKITTLGRGLSTGTELEYSDGDTLKSALENRH